MSTLNLSLNGPSIKSSYQYVINGNLATTVSPTYSIWALFSVQAPLMSAFQEAGTKESILKVQTTGEGELSELLEDFNEGRIQFAFAKVIDPNSKLPKCVLIGWCGGGVPERTKGYYSNHITAVANVFHGYHIQVTARSESDLDPESIIQKVADSSGAKYSHVEVTAPPAAKAGISTLYSEQAVTPKHNTGSKPSMNIHTTATDLNREPDPPINQPHPSMSHVGNFEPLLRPTKAKISDNISRQDHISVSSASGSEGLMGTQTRDGIVKGGYQPVGKVDIAAIRASAQSRDDDRPVPIKGAYEPVGRVDMAAIKAHAHTRPDTNETGNLLTQSGMFEAEKSPRRLASIPQASMSNRTIHDFSGTRPSVPVSLGLPGSIISSATAVGVASRTFADEGGKTPAQLWAERKAKGHTNDVNPTISITKSLNVDPRPIGAGEWKSGYQGKSWAPVQTASYGRILMSEETNDDSQLTANSERSKQSLNNCAVSSLCNKFQDASIQHGASQSSSNSSYIDSSHHLAAAEPLPHFSDKTRHEDVLLDDAQKIPPLPPAFRSAITDIQPEETHISTAPNLESSMSVINHAPIPETSSDLVHEETTEHANKNVDHVRQLPILEPDGVNKTNLQSMSSQSYDNDICARVQYDYEKAEDNEVTLVTGEIITSIQMVDQDWWLGTNSQGDRGLFPSNYVERISEGELAEASEGRETLQSEPLSIVTPKAPQVTATALFDYEPAEDNEIGFNEGAVITAIEFPDDDWWFGTFDGKSGLFPANYVNLDS